MSRKASILFFVLVSVVGTLLHFVFDWSGKNPIVGLVAPVNESTWEHLKLLFFPVLLFTLGEVLYLWRKGKPVGGFLTARTFALCLGLFVIVAAFYTYSGILGQNYLIADILTFLLGVGVTAVFTEKWASRLSSQPLLALAILVLLTGMFFLFTFNPPAIGLFRDPVAGGFGIGK